MFFAFYKDTGIMGVTPKPYPDGANIRFFSDTGLGPFPAGVIEPDVFYGLDGETQDIPPGLLTFVGTDYYYYKVVFPVGYEVDLSTVNTSDWLIDVSITGTVPRVSVGKGFAFTDYPFNIGTFNLQTTEIVKLLDLVQLMEVVQQQLKMHWSILSDRLVVDGIFQKILL